MPHSVGLLRTDAATGPLDFVLLELSPKPGLLLVFFFAGFRQQGQSKYRLTSQAGDISASRLFVVWQVQRPAALAAIDFGPIAERLAHIPAFLLQNIRQIKPALQMTAAHLAFIARFVTSSLKRLLVLQLVMGKLRSRRQAILGHAGSIAGCGEYLNISSSYGCVRKYYDRS